jgi:uncharacterized protein YndB with AHSA1/START domain
MDKLMVERDIWIKAPIDRVWHALTDDKQFSKWWGERWVMPELRVGGEIAYGEPGETMTAVIEIIDPPREFAFRWPPQPLYYSTEMRTVYRLEEEDGGTRVYVAESGFENMPGGIGKEQFECTREGYGSILASLKAHVEGGE